MEKFSKKVNRKNTKSYKWDTLEEKFGNPEAVPFWVADMDFRVPEAIEKAIKKERNILFLVIQSKQILFINLLLILLKDIITGLLKKKGFVLHLALWLV